MPKREWLLRAVIAALPRARSEWTRAVMAEMADVPADQRGSWAAGGVRVAAGETFSPSALHHQGPVVEAVGLSKRYGARVVAVDGLDLRIERGETYGLLGPNGAGKTTTIRMVLGLVRPSSGSVTVLGRPAGSAAAIRSIGAMGDTAFYPFLSGRDNLRALARRAGVDDDRVETVLEQVSLRPRAGDHFSGYSLGMKQRLGVAAALLKDPVLLVLDEPSNGLDPEGQLEMRRLITRLRAGGRTILLSSHDLDEVERLCDRVGIVAGGRMLAEGTPDSLRGDPRLDIQATPLQAAAEISVEVEQGAEVVVDGERLRITAGGRRIDAAALNTALVEAGIDVTELRATRRSLEETFLALTGGRTGGADSMRKRIGE